jgi:Na+/proline symporter
MAHTAPTSGTPRTPATTSGAPVPAHRPPDLFDRRTHALGRLAVPLAIGLVYGYWAAAVRRDGGPITGWNLLFGFVCAIVFAALCAGLLVMAPRLRRELHATAWTAFSGVAVGFLVSQDGSSVLRSAAIAIGVAAIVFLFDFYRYYTHEDAQGHRIA